MKGERITTVLDITRDGRLLILEFIAIILDPTQTDGPHRRRVQHQSITDITSYLLLSWSIDSFVHQASSRTPFLRRII